RARREVVAALLEVSPRIGAGHASSPVTAGRFWVEPPQGPSRRSGAGGARSGEAQALLEGWIDETRALVPARLGPARVTVGPTATVAWAAALGAGAPLVPPDAAASFLGAAPLEVLELPADHLLDLRALGVRDVAALRALDPASLGARFGPALAAARRRLDDLGLAAGSRADRRGPSTPRSAPAPEVTARLDDPVTQVEALTFLLAPAARQLVRRARAVGVAVVAAELRLDLRVGLSRPARGAPAPLRVPLRSAVPLAEGDALLAMLRGRLEDVRLPAPVHGFTLQLMETAPFVARSERLFPALGDRDASGMDARAGARAVALDRLARRGATPRRATPRDQGHPLERARWETRRGPRLDVPAAATASLSDAESFAADVFEPSARAGLPWRRVDPPAPVRNGAVTLAGQRRRVVRLSRVERATPSWWEADAPESHAVELLAWAELEGPLLALLRAAFTEGHDDRWEVVATVE
ncbi:MAG: hypothetical protein AAF447_28545, partial [Myxococcota bacterium]